MAASREKGPLDSTSGVSREGSGFALASSDVLLAFHRDRGGNAFDAFMVNYLARGLGCGRVGAGEDFPADFAGYSRRGTRGKTAFA